LRPNGTDSPAQIALSILDQTTVMTGIMEVLSERGAPNSELCLIAFLDTRLQVLANQPPRIFVQFVCVYATLVSKGC
jgi:hypothetical protein